MRRIQAQKMQKERKKERKKEEDTGEEEEHLGGKARKKRHGRRRRVEGEAEGREGKEYLFMRFGGTEEWALEKEGASGNDGRYFWTAFNFFFIFFIFSVSQFYFLWISFCEMEQLFHLNSPITLLF